jgi:hypothetical protein
MSLKSIEMQVALPRTLDATKLHDQLQQREQRGQLINDQANEEVKKEVEKQRNFVIKNENLPQTTLRNQKQEHKKDKNEQHSDKEKQNVKHEHHPYKGNFIDYSG